MLSDTDSKSCVSERDVYPNGIKLQQNLKNLFQR